MIVKKWQNKLDRRSKTKKLTFNGKVSSPVICDGLREQSTHSQINRDQDHSEQPFVLLWPHLFVQQCFIDAAVYLRSPVYNARLPRQSKKTSSWLVWMSDRILAAKCFQLERQNNGCLCCVKQTQVSVHEGKCSKCGPAALSEWLRFYFTYLMPWPAWVRLTSGQTQLFSLI